MRLSKYFVPTLRDLPAEACAVSHKLMLKSGMIQQISSGIYAWLPLGLRVLQKIEDIIRREHDSIGALEMLAPTLQPADIWIESGRYDDYGKEMLRFDDRGGRELIYGPTAEEVFTYVFRSHVHSYKDLPKILYNIQWKFRDEVRPRFGVMRGREFLMKDAYSFDLTKDAAVRSYEMFFQAYIKAFTSMGLSVIPVRANTGPIGGDLSHEFQILAETGESEIYYDSALDEKLGCTSIEDYEGIYAMAGERHDGSSCPIEKERLIVSRGIEVGHIFYFGTKYSGPLNAYVTSKCGERVPVEMGSYGIGVSRLVGAIIEAFHDDKGIIWPESVAPFLAVIIPVNEECVKMGDEVYHSLLLSSRDILYDDRKKSAGIKFADADLMGMPYQIIIGPEKNARRCVEVKNRKTGESIEVKVEQLDQILFSSTSR
ncbi:proline--tRNA ligase [Candidatus Hydrogenosomobacter endosymbioticus]|uniref:Proline--tRNA ligase n=1 Tax=Candidatus Hydrogenosomobacter endosymbioticus TaxID=2558174 RepID=A0ABM7V9U9_9PROT|nr:proline--tRNA ligase [Candidatus Hydrogenosomobacter endosymbioticus]BDB96573.1 proline--tRNA ligase [Candidatus Hydrogenosomobacter endosymbioticus]